MIKDESFGKILKKVIQEEKDGSFLALHKRKGLLLPGLSDVMLAEGMGDIEVAKHLTVSDRAIRHYRQETRGVKGIEAATRIAYVLRCSLKDLTTYEELARYHSPLNSFANQRVVSVSREGTTSRPHHVTRWTKARGILSRIFG